MTGRNRSVSPFAFVTETFTVLLSVECLAFCPAGDTSRLSFLRDCLLSFCFGFDAVIVVNESSVAFSSTREISLRDVSCGRVLLMEGSDGNDKLFRREESIFDIVCVSLFEDASAFPAKPKP